MDEQEEIDSNINLEQDGIILPDVENEEVQDDNIEQSSDNQVNDEKESLKRGVNRERKARKEAERKYKELEAELKALKSAKQEPQKTTVEELIEQGVDKDIASSIANAIDKKQDDSIELKRQIAELKFDSSLNAKSKEEGFENILDYADEIKDLVDKGLTIEQSYYAVSYDKSKTKNTKSEIERKVEARLQNNQARKDILGNYNSQTGASQKSKVANATAEEKAIASMAGMTTEEYIAMRDMQSVKDYNKYKSMKK